MVELLLPHLFKNRVGVRHERKDGGQEVQGNLILRVEKRVVPFKGCNRSVHLKFSVGCVATPTRSHPAAPVKLAGGVNALAMA